MKEPQSFLTNTTTPAGRTLGAAKNNPGDNSGSGMDKEIYNDPAYAILAIVESYKEGGNSDADETLTASDHRDAVEEMTGRKISGVSDWNVSKADYAVNDLVMRHGWLFVCYYATGATGMDPVLPAGRPFWKKCKSLESLFDFYDSGEEFITGTHPVSDRAGAKYQQTIKAGYGRIGGNGGTFRTFYQVHLDGTVVTGDTFLNDTVFKEGTADEYWDLDTIAPDVMGTRTLLDLGDYVSVPQSSGGDADTIGELVADQLEDHYHFSTIAGGSTFFRPSAASLDGQQGTNPSVGGVYTGANAGSTTHGKRFTKGAAARIIMV